MHDGRGRSALVLLRVGEGQSRKHTLDDVPRDAVRQAGAERRAEPKQARERDALDVVEHDRRESLVFDERPHLPDRWMREARAEGGLAREGTREGLVAPARVAQNLDGDPPPATALREKHLPRAPRA